MLYEVITCPVRGQPAESIPAVGQPDQPEEFQGHIAVFRFNEHLLDALIVRDEISYNFV